MAYLLRRCQPGEGETLSRFVIPIATRAYQAWAASARVRRWAESEHSPLRFEQRLADPDTHVLVCERMDESMAACAYVRLAGEVAHLGGLYVADSGRGLGRHLLQERLRIAQEADMRVARSLVRETNLPARRLVEQHGFVCTGHDRCGLLDCTPRRIYELPLHGAAAAISA